jgi:uncharacterized damage-inducible protein DinB
MDELAELHRFNAWANRGLLDAVSRLHPDQLTERRDGMYDTVLGVLHHLSQVELVYVRLIASEPYSRPAPSATLDEVEQTLAESGARLVEAASGPGEARVHIPWFERDFSVAQCLRQVLTHSINHRADVNGWLPRFGAESIDVDYIDLALLEG